MDNYKNYIARTQEDRILLDMLACLERMEKANKPAQTKKEAAKKAPAKKTPAKKEVTKKEPAKKKTTAKSGDK